MVEHELIAETLYIQTLITTLKSDPAYRQSLINHSIAELDSQLEAATNHLHERLELYFHFLISVGAKGRRP
jgi:hypothetical protein